MPELDVRASAGGSSDIEAWSFATEVLSVLVNSEVRGALDQGLEVLLPEAAYVLAVLGLEGCLAVMGLFGSLAVMFLDAPCRAELHEPAVHGLMPGAIESVGLAGQCSLNSRNVTLSELLKESGETECGSNGAFCSRKLRDR
mmetsp:Transcript_16844/g.33758  ORF Transcript_16844/g.33758 Transcript_16844/m.33758 type:complete len:142 (-) Transcript_16844:36-461(-)